MGLEVSKVVASKLIGPRSPGLNDLVPRFLGNCSFMISQVKFPREIRETDLLPCGSVKAFGSLKAMPGVWPRNSFHTGSREFQGSIETKTFSLRNRRH